MQRSATQIIGYSIGAADGRIGQVKDFLFDDHAWVIRYLVADTGKWLPGRKVLLSPGRLKSVDWLDSVLHVSHTKKEIEDSPPLKVDEPVSRQREEELNAYFSWPAYWAPGAPVVGPGVGVQPPQLSGPVRPGTPETPARQETPKGDPHLRSIREVTGYGVQTTDGKAGHIEDFVVDDQAWAIRYVVVDTANWWPGKKVILAPDWVAGLSWDNRQVRFDLTKAALEGAPEFDPSRPINREYEEVLYDYYGRPHYWATARRQQSRS